jgi:hypothetical protein
MCDYSLHNVKSRPAKIGDKLTTHFFQSGTRGFCAPEDTSDSRLCPTRYRALLRGRSEA